MLSTKGIQPKKVINKILSPGNRMCKVNSIKLEEDKIPANMQVNAMYVMLNLEGVDMGPDFQGFAIDSTDKTKGFSKGQIGKVKNGYYSFKNTVIKGEDVFRDDQILSFLSRLAVELGVKAELDKIEASTIEEMVDKASILFNNGKFLNFCIGGRNYLNKSGYDAYDLFLVKADKGHVSFESADVKEEDSKLTKYDANNINHFKPKKAAAPVAEFSATETMDLKDDLPF